MTRLLEELAHTCVFAPQAVVTATLKTTEFVDVSNVPEVEFLVSTGPLATGKKLTVGIYASAKADGTGAVKVDEAVFTAAAEMKTALVAVSYRVTAKNGRYIGVKLKHDAATDLCCGVTANLRVRSLPADNALALLA